MSILFWTWRETERHARIMIKVLQIVDDLGSKFVVGVEVATY